MIKAVTLYNYKVGFYVYQDIFSDHSTGFVYRL